MLAIKKWYVNYLRKRFITKTAQLIFAQLLTSDVGYQFSLSIDQNWDSEHNNTFRIAARAALSAAETLWIMKQRDPHLYT